MPSGRWRITKSGEKIVREFLDGEAKITAADTFAVLAIKTDEDQVKNERLVADAHSKFTFAVFAFAASTVLWLFELGIARVLAIGIKI